MKTSSKPCRLWLALGSTALLGLGLTPGAQAHKTEPAQPQRQLAREAQLPRIPGEAQTGAHTARSALPPSQLPLRHAESLSPQRQRIGEASPSINPASLSPAQQAARALQDGGSRRRALGVSAAAASCSGSDFVGKSGAALISFIDQASLRNCMYTLYQGSVDQYRSVFSDANIISVANELKARTRNYPGNDSVNAMNLLSYLRTAGYWGFMSQAGDSSSGIAPGSRSMMNAAMGALSQLAQSPRFYDLTEDNAYFASEVFKTVPSGFATAFAGPAKRWIDQMQPSGFATGYWTNETVLAAMNVLYYGAYQVDFRNQAKNDLSYARSLDAFLTRNRSLIGGSYSYHLDNALGEMLRFLSYPTLQAQVRNLGINQLAFFSATQDSTVDAWLRAASMVDDYDSANCSAYGTCNARDRIAAIKLPIRYACGSDYTIRAQAMTPQQLAEACTSISNQTAYFHTLMGTSASQPVANDLNSKLELVVFDSSDQYKRFSGYLFGNNTNNGGIYLEGTPSVPGNTARFLAHRAEWLPGFEIWNLNHEFTHYLDGRYNFQGGFGDYPIDLGYPVANSAVWWIEGVAEYVSYSYRRKYYADATSRAQTAPVALSELLRNTYDSGSARVYSWGYLAARYMLERQPQVDRSFLPQTRTGNYAGYSQQIDALGKSLDGDFASWLNTCIGGGDTSSTRCASQRPGTLPLLDASAIGACKLSANNTLANGCSRALSGQAAQDYYIDATGWSKVVFKLSQVQGGADVYARAGNWASSSSYDLKGGSNGGSDVSLSLPTAGQRYIYVRVVPRADFQSAQLRGMFSDLPLGNGGNSGGGSDPTPPNPPTPSVPWYQAPACTDADQSRLDASSGCTRSGLSGAANSARWMAVIVPPGKTSVTVRATGGSGNADLYMKANGWPSSSDYGCRSNAADNTESCTLSGLSPNTWIYLLVQGSSAYSGLTMAASSN